MLIIGVVIACGAMADEGKPTSPALSPGSKELITPEELVKLLQSPESYKFVIIQVGFHRLYDQAHIPNSEYIGPASNASGLQQLRARVLDIKKKNTPIVLYCGCCPWDHCPNVKPAFEALQEMGFTNVKVLYIADNFGANWVDKGYPTEGRR